MDQRFYDLPMFAVDEQGYALITEEQYTFLYFYTQRLVEDLKELEGELSVYSVENRTLSKERESLQSCVQKLEKRIYMMKEVAAQNNFEYHERLYEIDDLKEQNERYRKVIKETLAAFGVIEKQKYGRTLERSLEE